MGQSFGKLVDVANYILIRVLILQRLSNGYFSINAAVFVPLSIALVRDVVGKLRQGLALVPVNLLLGALLVGVGVLDFKEFHQFL